MTWGDAVDKSSISTARRVDNLQSMFRYADGSGQILTTCHGCRAKHCFEVTVEDQARLDGYTDWEPEEAAPNANQPTDAVERADYEEYEKEAMRLLKVGDVKEIASSLAVRDAACALYVTEKLLLSEPEDADVIAWLDGKRAIVRDIFEVALKAKQRAPEAPHV
jgi:hypothetical protein